MQLWCSLAAVTSDHQQYIDRQICYAMRIGLVVLGFATQVRVVCGAVCLAPACYWRSWCCSRAAEEQSRFGPSLEGFSYRFAACADHQVNRCLVGERHGPASPRV